MDPGRNKRQMQRIQLNHMPCRVWGVAILYIVDKRAIESNFFILVATRPSYL